MYVRIIGQKDFSTHPRQQSQLGLAKFPNSTTSMNGPSCSRVYHYLLPFASYKHLSSPQKLSQITRFTIDSCPSSLYGHQSWQRAGGDLRTISKNTHIIYTILKNDSVSNNKYVWGMLHSSNKKEC